MKQGSGSGCFVGSASVFGNGSDPDSYKKSRIRFSRGSDPNPFFSRGSDPDTQPCLRVEKTLSSILTNGNAHLLGEDEVQLKEKDAPLATLSDQLLRVPHVEGVLQTLLMLNRLTN